MKENEDSKKSHDKKKNVPKEQRRPRQRHQQATEKKNQKNVDEPKVLPQVAGTQKPVYESPPPEFFKNLKRETDEILKITEEESAKYKKKEIQSNWSKYEIPIDTYEEIEECENMGADYEKLVQASHSIGGHFQFKHEKSWDLNSGPSLYDKYFDINMDDLYLSLCTIPFYERNGIEQSLFNETDILSMNNKTVRAKQKYFNDKSISTADIEAQDRILDSLREKEKIDDDKRKESIETNDLEISTAIEVDKSSLETSAPKELEIKSAMKVNIALKESTPEITDPLISKENSTVVTDCKETLEENTNTLSEEIVVSTTKSVVQKANDEIPKHIDNKIVDDIGNDDFIFGNTKQSSETIEVTPRSNTTAPDKAGSTSKNPVVESPEDLEKWLDDFLDG